MHQDEEHLKLLAIFHYVVGGVAALFSLFPLIHVALGLFLIIAPGHMDSSGEVPPAFVGWFFVIVAGSIILCGWIMAACIIGAGRCLARRKRYIYCLVIAGIECLFMPFGTVLGVFTIVVLNRESVKALFDSRPPAGPV